MKRLHPIQTRLYLMILAFFLSVPFIWGQDIPGVTQSEDYVAVRFSKYMTKDELKEIKKWARENGYELNYVRTEFYDNGGLRGIEFKVKTSDGYSGSAAEFPLKEGKPVGFYRDKRLSASSPFDAGILYQQLKGKKLQKRRQ